MANIPSKTCSCGREMEYYDGYHCPSEECETNIEFKFPHHKCGLQLEHNECRNYYQTVAQYLKEIDDREMNGPDWKSEQHKQRAIDTNEIWTLHWYPETPISFYHIAAPTFQELLEFAKEYGNG